MSHHHDDIFKLHTPDFNQLNKKLDRRAFLTKTSLGLGALAMGSLLGKSCLAARPKQPAAPADWRPTS